MVRSTFRSALSLVISRRRPGFDRPVHLAFSRRRWKRSILLAFDPLQPNARVGFRRRRRHRRFILVVRGRCFRSSAVALGYRHHVSGGRGDREVVVPRFEHDFVDRTFPPARGTVIIDTDSRGGQGTVVVVDDRKTLAVAAAAKTFGARQCARARVLVLSGHSPTLLRPSHRFIPSALASILLRRLFPSSSNGAESRRLYLFIRGLLSPIRHWRRW